MWFMRRVADADRRPCCGPARIERAGHVQAERRAPDRAGALAVDRDDGRVADRRVEPRPHAGPAVVPARWAVPGPKSSATARTARDRRDLDGRLVGGDAREEARVLVGVPRRQRVARARLGDPRLGKRDGPRPAQLDPRRARRRRRGRRGRRRDLRRRAARDDQHRSIRRPRDRAAASSSRDRPRPRPRPASRRSADPTTRRGRPRAPSGARRAACSRCWRGSRRPHRRRADDAGRRRATPAPAARPGRARGAARRRARPPASVSAACRG